ncbi:MULTISPECIES: hypothetical protein [Paenibacillus]|uniref:hypothetical protein n=1 Tax=Paenibacillus TaxID=44249 RepID=UPI0022B8ED54|nr:hypothetical protein [Paenibacillus caseinilyticus]MCZ8520074.1 hypothetical protein [Paenibacillus caseinilyticus]
MNIGGMIRGLIGEAQVSEPKSLELKVGQVVKGMVTQLVSDHEAVLNIGGVQVRAQLETPLKQGEVTMLQVQPESSGGQIVLKPMQTSNVQIADGSLGEVLKTVGLEDTPANRQLVQGMHQAGVSLSKENVQQFADLMKSMAPGTAVKDVLPSAVIAFQKGLPLTPDTVNSIRQAVQGQPFHEMVDGLAKLVESELGGNTNLSPQSRALLDNVKALLNQVRAAGLVLSGAAEGARTQTAQPGVGAQAGTQAEAGAGPQAGTRTQAGTNAAGAGAAGNASEQASGTAPSAGAQARGEGRQAGAGTQAGVGTQAGAGAGTQAAAVGANAQTGAAANASAQAGTGATAGAGAAANASAQVAKPGASAAAVAGAGAATNASAQAGATGPGAGTQAGAVSVAGGIAPSAGTQTGAMAGTGAAATAGAQAAQPGADAGAQAAQPGASTASVGASAGTQAAQPGAAAADTSTPASPQTEQPAAMAAADAMVSPQEHADHDGGPMLQRLMKALGVEHEQQAAKLLDPPLPAAGAAGDAPKTGDSLKSVLMQLSQSDEVPAVVKEAAQQAVQQITGQQLMLSQDRTAMFSHITLFVPLLHPNGDQTAAVHIQSRKGKNGKLDEENCRLVFDLQMKSLGDTMVDVQVVNRIVSLHVLNDEPFTQTLLDSFKDEIAKGMEAIGYQFISMKCSPYPEKTSLGSPGSDTSAAASPNAATADQRASLYNRKPYKGVDIRL